MVKGVPLQRQLFHNADFDIDPLVSGVYVNVREVATMRRLQEVYAEHMGLDWEEGIMCRAELPYYAPEDVSHGEERNALRLYGVRREEMASVRLKADAQTEGRLSMDLRMLPDR